MSYVEKRLLPESPTEDFSISYGYYDTLDQAIETAFAMGKTAAIVTPVKVDVIYNVKHTHGTYCYPIASATKWSSRGDVGWEDAAGEGHVDHDGFIAHCKCSVCGKDFTAGDAHYWKNAPSRAESSYLKHLTGGRCTKKGYQCGKEEGEQQVTDVTLLGAGDEVISAIINF